MFEDAHFVNAPSPPKGVIFLITVATTMPDTITGFSLWLSGRTLVVTVTNVTIAPFGMSLDAIKVPSRLSRTSPVSDGIERQDTNWFPREWNVEAKSFINLIFNFRVFGSDDVKQVRTLDDDVPEVRTGKVVTF